MVIVERLWIPCKQPPSVSDCYCWHFDKSFTGDLTGFLFFQPTQNKPAAGNFATFRGKLAAYSPLNFKK